MTTIISALNQKGGAGKTTMAINLAACLIEQGRRVVVAGRVAPGTVSHRMTWCGRRTVEIEMRVCLAR